MPGTFIGNPSCIDVADILLSGQVHRLDLLVFRRAHHEFTWRNQHQHELLAARQCDFLLDRQAKVFGPGFLMSPGLLGSERRDGERRGRR
ncbi:MAG: hypothetical protein B7Z55_06670 [Planctomycetales bacterium 12-60-4]|nr:MAG: hypothetical protein B7Z55_06670 [Planctomycetales bacterium 12-60-4]